MSTEERFRTEVTWLESGRENAIVTYRDVEDLPGWLADTLYTVGNNGVIVLSDGGTTIYRGLR